MKTIRYALTNKKGMSLIGVLVALAISTIVISGVSTMLVQMSKQISMLQDKVLHGDLFEEIKRDFIKKDSCDNLLKGSTLLTSLNYIGLKSLKQPISISAKTIKNEFPYLQNNTTPLKFKSFDLNLTEKVTTTAPFLYTGQFTVAVERNGKIPGHVRPRKLPKVEIETDVSGKVLSCTLNSGAAGVDFVGGCNVQEGFKASVLPTVVKSWGKGCKQPGKVAMTPIEFYKALFNKPTMYCDKANADPSTYDCIVSSGINTFRYSLAKNPDQQLLLTCSCYKK